MSVIHFDELDNAAWNGSLDGVIPWYEDIYFQSMAILCEKVRLNMVTKEQATEIKAHLRKECNDLVSAYEFGIHQCETAAERYKNTEYARNEYRKNRTLENADKMLAAFDGLEVHGDE